jgi:UDP-N-acetylmuramoylalanine--D-glutamate ligase
VYYLAKVKGKVAVGTLLLSGIAVSLFFSALITFSQYIAGERQLQEMMFWLMGGLWTSNWEKMLIAVPLVFFGSIGILCFGRDLNILLSGEEQACSLGVDADNVRKIILILVAIVEVSSFQAEDLRHFTPEAVLWTNFDEDHLDRHGDLESYFRAKFRLIERMMPGGILVVGESVVSAARSFGIELPAEAIVATRADVADTVPAGSVFDSWPQRENWAILCKYWQVRGIPMRHLEESARLFRVPPHRLRKVAENKGIEFWNDSKGTNFHAVQAALSQFSSPVRWIGGGKWKGGDLARFVRNIAPLIDAAYLIGETADELKRHFEQLGKTARCYPSLQDAVVAAAKDAPAPSVILLSPGFSSFDQFRGYAERGLVFERAASALANRV